MFVGMFFSDVFGKYFFLFNFLCNFYSSNKITEFSSKINEKSMTSLTPIPASSSQAPNTKNLLQILSYKRTTSQHDSGYWPFQITSRFSLFYRFFSYVSIFVSLPSFKLIEIEEKGKLNTCGTDGSESRMQEKRFENAKSIYFELKDDEIALVDLHCASKCTQSKYFSPVFRFASLTALAIKLQS